jgi:nuclear transport factor 2 (NTF2) superfamily protein
MNQPSTHPLLHQWWLELEDLPDGSVVLDQYNHAWQNSRGYWYRSYGDDSEVSSWELHFKGPGRTIWRPDD